MPFEYQLGLVVLGGVMGFLLSQFLETHKAKVGVAAKKREKYHDRQGIFLVDLHARMMELTRLFGKLEGLSPFEDDFPFSLTDKVSDGKQHWDTAFETYNKFFVFFEDSCLLLPEELIAAFWKLEYFLRLKFKVFASELGQGVYPPASELPDAAEFLALKLGQQVKTLRGLMRDTMRGDDKDFDPEVRQEYLKWKERVDSFPPLF